MQYGFASAPSSNFLKRLRSESWANICLKKSRPIIILSPSGDITSSPVMEQTEPDTVDPNSDSALAPPSTVPQLYANSSSLAAPPSSRITTLPDDIHYCLLEAAAKLAGNRENFDEFPHTDLINFSSSCRALRNAFSNNKRNLISCVVKARLGEFYDSGIRLAVMDITQSLTQTIDVDTKVLYLALRNDMLMRKWAFHFYFKKHIHREFVRVLFRLVEVPGEAFALDMARRILYHYALEGIPFEVPEVAYTSSMSLHLLNRHLTNEVRMLSYLRQEIGHPYFYRLMDDFRTTYNDRDPSDYQEFRNAVARMKEMRAWAQSNRPEVGRWRIVAEMGGVWQEESQEEAWVWRAEVLKGSASYFNTRASVDSWKYSGKQTRMALLDKWYEERKGRCDSSNESQATHAEG